MIRNNTPTTNNRAVLPVFGVLLLIAITVILAAIIGVILLFAGTTLIGPHINLVPYLPHLLALYLISEALTIYRKRRNQQATTLENCIEFTETTTPITNEDTDTDKLHTITTSINTPNNTTLHEPLTVAPSNANPRNWTLATRLQHNNKVTFAINTDHIPTELKSNNTILTPNNSYGLLNAQYETNEINELTVYDAQLNEITTIELTK